MPRLALPLIVAVALAAGLTACGGSGNSGATQKQTAAVAFSKCMRANGVPTFPDQGGAGGGGLAIQASGNSDSGPQTITVDGTPVSGPAFQAAMTKCRPKLPHGGHPSAQQLARLRAGALVVARCMRAHGVPNFPDPQIHPGPGGGIAVRIGGPGSGLDPRSPAFQSAAKACMKHGQFALKAPGGGG